MTDVVETVGVGYRDEVCGGDSWMTSIIFLGYCAIRTGRRLTMVRHSWVSNHVRGHRKDCWQLSFGFILVRLSDIDSAGLEDPLRFCNTPSR